MTLCKFISNASDKSSSTSDKVLEDHWKLYVNDHILAPGSLNGSILASLSQFTCVFVLEVQAVLGSSHKPWTAIILRKWKL